MSSNGDVHTAESIPLVFGNKGFLGKPQVLHESQEPSNLKLVQTSVVWFLFFKSTSVLVLIGFLI
jgi:hypothetical protein